MIRTQIQLREDQSERLQRLARETDASMAELIRQSIDRFLDARAVPVDRPSRLAGLQVVGFAGSGLTDVSEHHDDYLEAAYLSTVGKDSGEDSAGDGVDGDGRR